MENKRIDVEMQKRRVVPKSSRIYGKGDLGFADELVLNLDREYPFAESVSLPLKNSVSVLLKKANENESFQREEFLTAPIYEDAMIKSTDVGIAYHSAMQCIDFDCEDNFLSRVQTNLTDEQFNVVDKTKILNCRKTILNLANAPQAKLHKEQKFMMYIPYNEIFTTSDISDCVIIQGIIDLFIEFDDQIILVDYKTNKTTNAEKLRENYTMQMSLYAKGLCENYNKKVTAYLYSFSMEKLILCE